MKYLILLFFISHHLYADVMELNNFMPTQMEDATPIDEKTLDIQYSLVSEKEEDAVMIHRPNIRYGITKELQFETQGTIKSGGDEDQSGESEVGLFYRFNQSENYFPEIALSPVLIFPTGKQMKGLDYYVKLNFTTTLSGSSVNPRTQVHFNYQFIQNNSPGDSERFNRGVYVLGISHLISPATALIVNGVLEEEVLRGDDSYLLEAGLHHHLGKDYYLGVGGGVGMGSSIVENQLILALEKQFP